MEQEVRETTAALADALNRGDAARAAALYVDDAILLTPTAELLPGRSEIESYWRAGIAVGLSRVDFETLELKLLDAVVVDIGTYAIVVSAEGGEAAIEHGKYLALHVEQADGSRRRAVDVFNPDGLTSARRAGKENAGNEGQETGAPPLGAKQTKGVRGDE